MAAPKNLDPLENPFGYALRRHRLRLGLTQEQLGKRLGYSGDAVGKFEKGDVAPSVDLGRRCDEEFGANGDMEQLAGLARHRAGFPRWFRWWAAEVEPFAHTLRNWEPLMISGLLQTEDYARELLKTHPGTTEEQVEEKVAARMERRKIFGREAPPVLWFLMAEGALHYEVGAPKVMREQLQHVVEMSHHTHVNIQVLPTSAGAHPGLNGAFWIASLDGEPDVLYLENARAGQVIDRTEDVQEIMNIWQAICTAWKPFRPVRRWRSSRRWQSNGPDRRRMAQVPPQRDQRRSLRRGRRR